ncbi:hypothetical protein [Bacillus alkalicellulosilyticus]|uniref:hypothetical protein n=1 Tax=Alkalihalobacterium alkalicellulosilyticum TaxID=1912214 RepID=UPI0009971DA1|nr:hypothetical protein [Bacillus alkalicellulosilyticus]
MKKQKGIIAGIIFVTMFVSAWVYENYDTRYVKIQNLEEPNGVNIQTYPGGYPIETFQPREYVKSRK